MSLKRIKDVVSDGCCKAKEAIDKVSTDEAVANIKNAKTSIIKIKDDLLNDPNKLFFDNAKNISDAIEAMLHKTPSMASQYLSVFNTFLSLDSLLDHLEGITKSAATIYDKALDSEYLKTSIGGGNHRLFDGGHDIFSAWDKMKYASQNDSLFEEIQGYTSALWKDVSTVKGLPFATIDKEFYDQWVEKITSSIPGLNKNYLYDLCSFDAFEILSSALGAAAIIFSLKRDDQEKIAVLMGSLGVTSIISANPIMGIMLVCAGVYAYVIKKKEFKTGTFSKSVIMTSASASLFAVLGLPILFELVIVMVLSSLLKKQILENRELHMDLKRKISGLINERYGDYKEMVKTLLYQIENAA